MSNEFERLTIAGIKREVDRNGIQFVTDEDIIEAFRVTGKLYDSLEWLLDLSMAREVDLMADAAAEVFFAGRESEIIADLCAVQDAHAWA